MTAEPASAPIVTTMPRLGRGVCWSDVTREIELDELDRQARRVTEAKVREAR